MSDLTERARKFIPTLSNAPGRELIADLTAALERVEKLADEWESVGEPAAAKLVRDALEGK